MQQGKPEKQSGEAAETADASAADAATDMAETSAQPQLSRYAPRPVAERRSDEEVSSVLEQLAALDKLLTQPAGQSQAEDTDSDTASQGAGSAFEAFVESSEARWPGEEDELHPDPYQVEQALSDSGSSSASSPLYDTDKLLSLF